jgi:hypothetical protein
VSAADPRTTRERYSAALIDTWMCRWLWQVTGAEQGLADVIVEVGQPCSWCLPGRRWPSWVSHGICDTHAKLLREQSADTCRSVVLESDSHREEAHE